jgi:hypothetical protein
VPNRCGKSSMVSRARWVRMNTIEEFEQKKIMIFLSSSRLLLMRCVILGLSLSPLVSLWCMVYLLCVIVTKSLYRPYFLMQSKTVREVVNRLKSSLSDNEHNGRIWTTEENRDFSTYKMVDIWLKCGKSPTASKSSVRKRTIYTR